MWDIIIQINIIKQNNIIPNCSTKSLKSWLLFKGCFWRGRTKANSESEKLLSFVFFFFQIDQN